jgi:hypothetical protein
VGISVWTYSGSGSFWYNFISSYNDIYYFNATVHDSVGNYNSTETRNVTIDTIYPSIGYTNPTTLAGGPYNLTAIWSNMTAIDANLLSISSTLELVNGVIPSYLNTTTLTPTLYPNDSLYYNWTGLSQGVYRLSGYATDKLGHTTYIVNRTISIDIDPPVMSYELPTPADGIEVYTNNFIINVTALDPNFVSQTIYYWPLNGTVLTQTTAGLTNTLSQTALADGLYYYNASGVDIASRTTWLPTRSVDVQYANQTVVACKELYIAGANYIIKNNLTSDGTCLNVTAPGVTIYCEGHKII